MIRTVTNRLNLNPVQLQAIQFAFDSAGKIFNYALKVALNELSFIPVNLPAQSRFYSDLVCSKKNKPQFEVLKDRKLNLGNMVVYLPKGAAQRSVFEAHASLLSFKENYWEWKQTQSTRKKSRKKPKPPQPCAEPRGFVMAAGRGLTIRDDFLILPKALGRPTIPLQEPLRSKLGIIKIRQVRIFPRWGEIYAAISYEVAKQQIAGYDRTRCLAIDPGVNCLATVNNIRLPPMLFKMGRLKHSNLQYREEFQRLSSIYKAQGITNGPALFRLLRSRYGYLRTEFGRLSKRIIQYCVRHRIGRIVVGHNKGWKQHGRLFRKDITSAFQLNSFELFNQNLLCKAEIEGIEVIFQKESYTSKASFDDGDFPSKSYRHTNGGFSGRRTSRTYITANGYLVHADVNAAANILKKYDASLAKREDIRIFNPVTIKW